MKKPQFTEEQADKFLYECSFYQDRGILKKSMRENGYIKTDLESIELRLKRLYKEIRELEQIKNTGVTK